MEQGKNKPHNYELIDENFSQGSTSLEEEWSRRNGFRRG